MQMPFAVNGVPIKDVAATRGETAKATSGATVATKGSLFGLLCVVAVVIVGLL
ncbi:hypothetical protein BC829DRAFT_394071 [Chytridium lagenaria]|nr:hypothetical protein BC829DRAFT_394071 [Chytridium lagenaria]